MLSVPTSVRVAFGLVSALVAAFGTAERGPCAANMVGLYNPVLSSCTLDWAEAANKAACFCCMAVRGLAGFDVSANRLAGEAGEEAAVVVALGTSGAALEELVMLTADLLVLGGTLLLLLLDI